MTGPGLGSSLGSGAPMRAAFLLGLLSGWGCASDPPPAPEAPAPAPTGARPEHAWPRTYAAELGALDHQIAFARGQLEKREDLPLKWALLIDQLAERARLTGEWDDWAAAEAAARRAFETNPTAPPRLAKANLDFSLHRLDAALGADDDDLRAAIAMERGDYATALVGFRRSHAAEPNHTSLARLAMHAGHTGDPAGAEALFRQAQVAYHGRSHRPRAWLALQLGLLALDAGRYDLALAHYRDADAAMTGWWLVREHVAEAERLAGRPETAREIYAALVAETQNPEFMDALALTLRDLGRDDEANRWVAEAGRAWDRRIAQFPEAAWGHALDHWLLLTDDAERALDLAQRNEANRPNGEASLKLAAALRKAGRLDEARARVAAVRSSGWRSPALAALEAALGPPTR